MVKRDLHVGQQKQSLESGSLGVAGEVEEEQELAVSSLSTDVCVDDVSV